MTKIIGFACHGLLIGEPVNELADFLNSKTPDDTHFNVIGGVDPQPLQGEIYDQVVAAIQFNATVVFIGHSKGAMLAFYLADQLNVAGLKAAYFASLDPTNWGSNLAGTWPWAVCVGAAAGQWKRPANIATWHNFYSPLAIGSPGGGICSNADVNEEITTDHLGIPASERVRATILVKVLALGK